MEKLIKEIAKQLKNSNIKGLSFTSLNIFRQFYLIYPQIIQTASEQFDFQQLKQALPFKQDDINQMEILVSEVKEKKIQTVSEQLVPSEILVH